MTTFILILFAVAVGMLWLIVLCCLFLSAAADRLIDVLKRNEAKSSGLAKWLRVQGKL